MERLVKTIIKTKWEQVMNWLASKSKLLRILAQRHLTKTTRTIQQNNLGLPENSALWRIATSRFLLVARLSVPIFQLTPMEVSTMLIETWWVSIIILEEVTIKPLNSSDMPLKSRRKTTIHQLLLLSSVQEVVRCKILNQQKTI